MLEKTLNVLKMRINSFYKNIIILTSGAITSQLVLILATPVLTRIYEPSSFGVFTIVITICSLLGVFSTLRYEHSLALTSSETETTTVLIINIGLAIAFFIFFLAILGLNIDIINSSIGLEKNIMPIIVLFTSISTSYYYYSNRRSAFKVMGSSKVIRIISQVTMQIILNFFLSDGVQGLLYGYVFGEMMYLLYLIIFSPKDSRFFTCAKRSKRNIINSLLKFKNFPLYDVPTTVFNTLSHMLPVFLIGLNWGAESAGFFALVQRVLSAPIAFISAGYLDVLKNEFSLLHTKKMSIKALYFKTISAFLLIISIPTLLIMEYGSSIFSFIFGERWELSGVMASVLVLLTASRVIAAPSVYIFFLLGKQKIGLIFNFIFLLMLLISYYFVHNNGNDLMNFLFIYTGLSVVLYTLYIAYTFSLVRSHHA